MGKVNNYCTHAGFQVPSASGFTLCFDPSTAGLYLECTNHIGQFDTARSGFPGQAAFNVLPDDQVLPTPEMPEVKALSAYLQWLSRGFEPGESAPWRRQNVIAQGNRLPLAELDPEEGEMIFMERCTNCHGEDGQGVQIGTKKAGPLWGPNSWNDGAGVARIYTLAGIIRYMMPYMDPGGTTDEEAQHLSAFVNSKERPSYPFKEQDYLTEPQPIDSVYYPSRSE